MSTKIRISDDCSINLIFDQIYEMQSDKIPKKRINNEESKIYSLKYSKFKLI